MSDKFRFYVTEQLSEHIAETPEGFLVCYDVPVTRTGEFIYRKGEVPVEPGDNGEIRILREEDEVFREETLLSLNAKPVTINHPSDFVGPDNWPSLAHGVIQNVRRGEGHQKDLMLGDLLITTEKAIELVKSGLREISLGYDAEYETISKGVGRQRNIMMNHIALVAKGRAGSRCAIGDKTCDGCGQCTCKKENIEEEDDMAVKGKIKQIRQWLDSFPFKDEDEETAEEKKAREEAQKAEKETADKAARDKGFKDAEEASEFEEWRKMKDAKSKDEAAKINPDGEEVYDKKAKDEEGELEKKEEEEKKEEGTKDDAISELSERIEKMEAFLKSLMESEEEKEESLDADEEEEKEDEEEKQATSDCQTIWPEIAHRAEILFPGMNLRKPTTDHAKNLRLIKIGALKGAALRNETQDAVQKFAKGKSFDSMPNAELDSVFTGASELIAAMNNAKIQSRVAKKPTKTGDFGFGGPVNVSAINQRNKEFYAKKN